jgi:hypothetical protein
MFSGVIDGNFSPMRRERVRVRGDNDSQITHDLKIYKE